MGINDFLVSYKMVENPTFEQAPDLEDPIDNFARLNEYNNSKQSQEQSKQSNDAFDWNMGLKGVQQESENIPASSNQIIQYFRNKGLSEALARGIYGNIMQESGGRLRAKSTDGHNSYGLAQWTGNRKLRLFSKYGLNPTLQNLLDYLWEELNTTEKRAFEDLKKQTTIEEATRSFMNKFERPHKDYANFNNRLKHAYKG